MRPHVPKAAMPAMRPERSSRAEEECFAAVGIEQGRCRGACVKGLTNGTGTWHNRVYILKTTSEAMDAKKFFTELKRRKVYRLAVAYAVVSWLLIQIATQVFPFFEIPTWSVRLVIIALVLGFPVALLLSWAFDLTPAGIRRTDDIDDTTPIAPLAIPKSYRSPPEKSIAVLPFENLSDDQRNTYFADGIQNDILSSVANVADLKVISRTSARQYRR